MYNTDDIDNLFVKSSYREGQREAIKAAIDAFNSGKRIVVIEAPTGSGKTAIGMTIAKFFLDSYWLTATKQLQDQLVTEHGDLVVELKGRNAYECDLWERMKDRKKWSMSLPQAQVDKLDAGVRNCAVGLCKSNFLGGRSKCKYCFEDPEEGIKLTADRRYSLCAYYEQLYKALDSRFMCMNFSSFLYQTTCTKDRFTAPRALLIADEAHNLGQEILSFINISLSDTDLSDHGYILPVYEKPSEYKKWFVDEHICDLFRQLEATATEEEDHVAAQDYARIASKLEMFVNSPFDDCEWVIDFETKISPSLGEYRILNLKPVLVGDFVNKFVFSHGHRILLLSATILDVNTFCNSIGVDRNEVSAIRLKNRFPVENRPIYYWPAAQMTGGKDRMSEWGPLMVASVEAIARRYSHQRGIIHTHNNAIMDYLCQYCEPGVARRLRSSKEYQNKSDLLSSHALSHDSIIISPSLYEGVDLADDLSRFQIVTKMPFANFYDDKQLAARMALDDKYYDWITVLRLVQSVGRSIRSYSDYADTFIIDGSFDRLFRKARSMFPSWFQEAVIPINNLGEVIRSKMMTT